MAPTRDETSLILWMGNKSSTKSEAASNGPNCQENASIVCDSEKNLMKLFPEGYSHYRGGSHNATVSWTFVTDNCCECKKSDVILNVCSCSKCTNPSYRVCRKCFFQNAVKIS
jgi:hypothetical protein